jgi:hypothetical protein
LRLAVQALLATGSVDVVIDVSGDFLPHEAN